MSQINQPPEILQKLANYAKSATGFLLLAGKNGTGKSFAAMAIYRYVCPLKLPEFDHDIAIFTTQTDLNLKWEKHRNIFGETVSLIDQFSKTKLLVLDDIGTRTPSDAFMDFLYSVADKRYSDREVKGTIITTNLNHVSMREKFGDAFTSRAASGVCIRFPDHEDRRFNPNFALVWLLLGYSSWFG